MRQKIFDIAGKIRREFEERMIPRDVLVSLYSAYNPKVDVDLFVDEAEKIFPKLNCGLTSVYLQSILGGEIMRGKFENNNHTFLLLHDFVVDITADQYGGEKVHVGSLKYPWSMLSLKKRRTRGSQENTKST